MARNMFLGSLALCLLFIGFTHISDPGILGIDEEPERIMFYGGSGLLAGLFGLVGLGSGIYLCVTRFSSLSIGQRRVMVTILLIVLIAVLTAFMIRFNPF
jgi:hypothetical protein